MEEGEQVRQPPSPSRKELVEPRHQAAQSSGGDKGPFVPPSPRGQGGAGPWRQAAPGTQGEGRDWQVGAWTLGSQGPVSWGEEQRVQTQEHPGEYAAAKRGRGQGGSRRPELRGWSRATRGTSKVRMAALNCR